MRTELDLDFVRSQFPALETPWVLMDNAGGSAPAVQVVRRMQEHMTSCPVQLGASYELSQKAAEAVQRGRAWAGELVGAPPEEIVLGPSSTLLVRLLAQGLRPLWREGDEVVVTNLDHEANIAPWRALEASGIVVREWKLRPESVALELEDLEPLLGERTRLVAFTHCSNITGTIQDVTAITERVRRAGALSCVDGVALAPHRAVDVDRLGADFYFLSFYKVFGPHLAMLRGRLELLEQAHGMQHFFAGRGQAPTKFEPGNVCYEAAASLVGIGEYFRALDRKHGGDHTGRRLVASVFERIQRQEEELVRPLLDFLASRPGVRVIGLQGAELAGRTPIVSFVIEGRSSADVPPLLEEERIGIRYGHFYSYRAIRDLGLLEGDGVVRISLAHYNTPDEVQRLIDVLEQIRA